MAELHTGDAAVFFPFYLAAYTVINPIYKGGRKTAADPAVPLRRAGVKSTHDLRLRIQR